MQILSLQTDDRNATMTLELADGSHRQLAYTQLRAACRCAECMAIKLRGGSIPAEGVTLIALQPIGSNALNLKFSDAHERGIYPLAYLVELSVSTGETLDAALVEAAAQAARRAAENAGRIIVP